MPNEANPKARVSAPPTTRHRTWLRSVAAVTTIAMVLQGCGGGLTQGSIPQNPSDNPSQGVVDGRAIEAVLKDLRIESSGPAIITAEKVTSNVEQAAAEAIESDPYLIAVENELAVSGAVFKRMSATSNDKTIAVPGQDGIWYCTIDRAIIITHPDVSVHSKVKTEMNRHANKLSYTAWQNAMKSRYYAKLSASIGQKGAQYLTHSTVVKNDIYYVTQADQTTSHFRHVTRFSTYNPASLCRDPSEDVLIANGPLSSFWAKILSAGVSTATFGLSQVILIAVIPEMAVAEPGAWDISACLAAFTGVVVYEAAVKGGSFKGETWATALGMCLLAVLPAYGFRGKFASTYSPVIRGAAAALRDGAIRLWGMGAAVADYLMTADGFIWNYDWALPPAPSK